MPSATTFGGIIPKLADHLLGDNNAIVALNCKLRNGKLEAWREPKPLTSSVADALTIWYKGCYPLSWNSCVSIAEFLPDSNRFYISGRQEYPEIVTLLNGVPSYTRLGLPAPDGILVASVAQTAIDRSSAARSYIYTYVNAFGEESAPSPPSAQLTVRDGSPVTLSGFDVPPAEYGIESIRVYRSATSSRTGYEKEQVLSTDYLLVYEVPVDVEQVQDSVLDRNLGHAISTREVRQPPSLLRHLGALEGAAMLFGVTRNQVHVSENMRPWSFPSHEDLTLDHNIVGAVSVGQYIIVSTDGNPYVIDGSIKCEQRAPRTVKMVDTKLPDISCGYANSSITTPFGMVYSSKDGIVLVKPDATVDILTGSWFGTDEWQKMQPHTARFAFWRGYLICVTEEISLMLQIDGNTYQDVAAGALTTISDKPIDMHVTRNGELLMLVDDIIYQWDASNRKRPYRWVSRETTMGGEASPTTAKIRVEGSTRFQLISADTLSVYERIVSHNKPFRLGRIGRHYQYHVGFEGTGTVDYWYYGMAMETVNGGI